MILGHNDYQVGDNRGVQKFWVKGHLGVIWGHCSNTLKMLLRLHDSIDFDETWVKRSSVFFRGVQEFLIGGHLGVIWGHC